MKDIKKRFEIFSFYDHTGMERHLEEMAKQGWILERLTNSRWVYRRAEPQRVHVTVSYDCRRSVFDPDGKEGEREEMFRHTGWKLVASSGKMQIFYNWEEDPLPLETDPVTGVESLHKAMRQSYLPMLYTLIQAKVPALYGMCQAQLLRQEEYRQVDAQPWAACEAYQKYREDRALTSYLLCYEQQLVTITFGWEPTQEQMNIVGEKLGGELH